MKTDYDSPWKDILETYFQSALELCFPQIARHINWARGVQLLSKEFQKIVRRSELGRRSVDVLVQVWSVAGREQWVLVHVEVQAQRDPEFPRRMFDYYSRIFFGLWLCRANLNANLTLSTRNSKKHEV